MEYVLPSSLAVTAILAVLPRRATGPWPFRLALLAVVLCLLDIVLRGHDPGDGNGNGTGNGCNLSCGDTCGTGYASRRRTTPRKGLAASILRSKVTNRRPLRCATATRSASVTC